MRLETDSSRATLAGVLSQKFKDGWHPIAFYSRNLTMKLNGIIRPTTTKWWQLLWVLNIWHHCLDGTTNITVYTHHHNSKDFISYTRLNKRQTCWPISFYSMNFTFSLKRSIEPRRWSIRFSATKPSSWDIKVDSSKAWYAASSEWVFSACVKGNRISFLAYRTPPCGKGWMDDVARRNFEIGMWSLFSWSRRWWLSALAAEEQYLPWLGRATSFNLRIFASLIVYG